MPFTMKPCFLALSVSALLSACSTTPVNTAQQFTAQEEQAALGLIADTINERCSAEGFAVESAGHPQCFWQHASKLRQRLVMAKHNELDHRDRVTGAHAIANRKLSAERSGNARGPQERREQQIARNNRR